MEFYVYIMANKRNGTIYTGMTNSIARRTLEHREGKIKGFTQRYGIKKLVYCETHDNVFSAKARERTLKGWPRKWKIELIEGISPQWDDLWDTLL